MTVFIPKISNAEQRLAKSLKLAGINFKQQVCIRQYCLDFLIANKLVVEISGVYHSNPEMRKKDLKKLEFLESMQFKVLDIPAEQIKTENQDWIDLIKAQLKG